MLLQKDIKLVCFFLNVYPVTLLSFLHEKKIKINILSIQSVHEQICLHLSGKSKGRRRGIETAYHKSDDKSMYFNTIK